MHPAPCAETMGVTTAKAGNVESSKPVKKIYRSATDKMIGGVCGGVAEYFGWDATLVRIAYALVSIFSAAFPGIIVYLVLWFIMPRKPAEQVPAAEN